MNKPLIETLINQNKTKKVPFWFMRQAGRYLPEYRALREEAGSFLDLCFNPEMASEVTLQPIKRFDMDAAILFSDILVIPLALGRDLTFVKGEGPKLAKISDENEIPPLRNTWDIERLSPIFETVSRTRRELSEDKALIGFCGAPWTVACYMINGEGSRDFANARRFGQEKPEAFSALLDILVETSCEYLLRQVKAGADAVKIFDSWAGIVSSTEYKKWVMEPTKKLIKKFHESSPGTPVIGFPKSPSPLMLEYAKETGADAVALDYATSAEWANSAFDRNVILQGNLDPMLLATDIEAALAQAKHILDTMRDRPFIFNLGHGMLPFTPVEHVQRLSEFLKGYSRD